MQQEIKQFKQQNGDLVKYTVKELIGGLDVKIDRILERLEKGEIQFAKINTTLTWHKRLILGLYSIWGGVLLALIGFILYMKRIIGGV